MERSNNPIENTQSHDLEVVTPPLSLEEKSAPRKGKPWLIFGNSVKRFPKFIMMIDRLIYAD